jgi:hypothetical protein
MHGLNPLMGCPVVFIPPWCKKYRLNQHKLIAKSNKKHKIIGKVAQGNDGLKI